ncbi:unnamed protein product [Leptosia nina]|uniref:Uncharacterized protein n=1 Tax=Leptosia nina TaxID=320188 RepID=A0AAV1JMZ6_9NEOP
MKLFVIAALIAVSAGARLEHLERSYLPPDNSNSISGGFGSPASNGLGSGHFGASARGSPSDNGFRNSAPGSSGFDNGFAGSLNGFGSGQGSNGAVDGLKQYLPPDQPSSGPSGFSGSIKPACQSCGFARNQPSSFGAQIPSTQYGQPQFGAPANQYSQPQFGVNSHHQFGAASRSSFAQPQAAPSSFNQPQFGAASGPSFGGHGGAFGRGSFGQEQPSQSFASRQYLAPKAQEIPQQPFDEQTGYQY